MTAEDILRIFNLDIREIHSYSERVRKPHVLKKFEYGSIEYSAAWQNVEVVAVESDESKFKNYLRNFFGFFEKPKQFVKYYTLLFIVSNTKENVSRAITSLYKFLSKKQFATKTETTNLVTFFNVSKISVLELKRLRCYKISDQQFALITHERLGASHEKEKLRKESQSSGKVGHRRR
jgi:hypothetical protein